MDEELSTSSVRIGKVWDGPSALRAYQAGNLFSNDARAPIRICMRYLVPDNHQGRDDRHHQNSVWFSWVDEQGALRPFRKLKPIAKSSIDGMTVTADDRIERSFLGHAFIFVTKCEDDDEHDQESESNTWEVKSLEEATVIGGYRPHVLSTNAEIDAGDYPCHMLDIEHVEKPKFLRLSACFPTRKQASSTEFPLVVREGNCLEPLDTTSKEYVEEKICRWPVCIEKDCFEGDKQARETFQKDLDYALSCIPGHVCKALKESKTCIYVNKSFQHGPKVRPEKAKGLCFHPNKEWLLTHGYSGDKAGCVELYDVTDYIKDRELWGRGGILIHELSHAYHNKCLADGYDNAEIVACYKQAMEEGLYNRVKVHGPQGPTQRAYACENAMEYFAELSTAFLGGKKENEEYNKWYPFNRSQVKEHDPRAYELLKKIWNV